MTTLVIGDASRVLASQPFSRLLGTRIAEFGDGRAVLVLPVRDELLQQDGYVHGGVLGYLADNALTFACGSALGPRVLTAGYHLDLVAPARGDVLLAEAIVVHRTHRRATARVDIHCGAGEASTLCAVAQGTCALITTASVED